MIWVLWFIPIHLIGSQTACHDYRGRGRRGLRESKDSQHAGEVKFWCRLYTRFQALLLANRKLCCTLELFCRQSRMCIKCIKGAYLSTTTRADLSAAWVGMLWGSSAWMFLPVGSTAGFLMGSPPGPGSTYLPSRACHKAQPSLIHYQSTSLSQRIAQLVHLGTNTL